MNTQEIGKYLRVRREVIGLTQTDLAEMAGTTARTIFDLETGRGNPSFKTLSAILEVLGLDITVQVKQFSQ